MTDYLDFNDLKAVVTNIVCSVGVLVAYRYWSNWSIKSLNRRVQQAEARKTLVENLAKSERAVLVFGFQTLFLILGLVCMVSAGQTIFLLDQVNGEMPLDLGVIMSFILLWGLPALVALSSSLLIKQVHDYPASLEIFEKKIERLKNRLRGRSRDKNGPQE
jgi:hypothetical protein